MHVSVHVRACQKDSTLPDILEYGKRKRYKYYLSAIGDAPALNDVCAHVLAVVVFRACG